MKESRLGSGVNALFSNIFDEEQPIAEGDGVREIDIALIDTNPNQPRKNFDQDALYELAESIKAHGVIQPVILAQNGNRYTIIAGERRYRACMLCKMTAVPAIVKEFSEREQKEIALIENLQREDLNPIEEAVAIKALMEEYNVTQEQIAQALGKSRPAIANSLRLLNLDPSVIEMVRAGRLSAGHARTLVAIKDPDVQYKYANASCDKKMSVRELETMVYAYLNPAKKIIKARPPVVAELKELVNDMQRIFATKIKAVGTEDKGRIYIDYYTKDDLQRIFELMEVLKQK